MPIDPSKATAVRQGNKRTKRNKRRKAKLVDAGLIASASSSNRGDRANEELDTHLERLAALRPRISDKAPADLYLVAELSLALRAAAVAHIALGDFTAALALHQEAVNLWREKAAGGQLEAGAAVAPGGGSGVGVSERKVLVELANSLNSVAETLVELGGQDEQPFHQALGVGEEALALGHRVRSDDGGEGERQGSADEGDEMVARSLHIIGVAHFYLGNLRQAKLLLSDATGIWKQCKDRGTLPKAADRLAMSAENRLRRIETIFAATPHEQRWKEMASRGKELLSSRREVRRVKTPKPTAAEVAAADAAFLALMAEEEAEEKEEKEGSTETRGEVLQTRTGVIFAQFPH